MRPRSSSSPAPWRNSSAGCEGGERKPKKPCNDDWPGPGRNWPLPRDIVITLLMTVFSRQYKISAIYLCKNGRRFKMIEALREEEIVHKVGGRFKLSTLIQKRLVALNSGARPLVNLKTDNKIEIVIQEILQDKIYLDTELTVQIAAGQQAPGAA